MHLFAPHLPLLTDVLNRRFFYVLCVNTFLNILGLWLLAGGGAKRYLWHILCCLSFKMHNPKLYFIFLRILHFMFCSLCWYHTAVLSRILLFYYGSH